MDSLSAMAGASSGSADGNTKMFSGENEDGKEYRRWKTWVINKLLTLDGKVSAKARGAYVYTLLQGKALECVEHLDPSEYHVEAGETKLLKLLDDRFPQKETLDEMSEVLTEVFSLKANDGETLKVWISRATECFDRCSRKCDVAFPEEAKGWLILHHSGLSEEQKAIVLARSGGAMKREAVGRAMRSCYPEYVVSKRKTLGAGLIEADAAENDEVDSDPILQEVEAFLAEHDSLTPAEEPEEVFEEQEVAEALAVGWKEKRKELSQMQRSRRFGAAQDLRKSYRVEIEELKKKTRCHKCHQVGHWSRECRSGKGKGRGSGSAKSADTGAALVEPFREDFVAAVSICPSTDQIGSTLMLLRQRRAERSKVLPDAKVCPDDVDPLPDTLTLSPVSPEVLLVSSPGYGIIDSGCGRTIVGRETLEEFKQLWKDRGIPIPEVQYELNHFKFGNGERETSESMIRVPVVIAGRQGVIKAAIVKGRAPLLISRNALQSLQAVVDFGRNEMKLFADQVAIPLHTNEAGQYVIHVIGDVQKANAADEFEEVMMNQSALPASAEAPSDCSDANVEIAVKPAPVSKSSLDADPGQPNPLQVWCRHDSYISKAITSGKQGPPWQAVKHRRVIDSATGNVLFDEPISTTKPKKCYHQDIPKEVLHVTTEFHFQPQEKMITTEALACALRASIRVSGQPCSKDTVY